MAKKINRPDPLIPCKPGAEDVEAMQNRVEWLSVLYKHDGRHAKDHPMHGLFTGLFQQYGNLSIADDLFDHD